ncbi:MAG: Oxygen-independent coproporphyrinogen-III oxidase-like protein YqeR [Anaerolineales bacterium]|nr:Oxygen-independent coproporphyrinogen-III oxidase-like protein YqeR [Anaerolineales bacterium]
MYSLYFHIPFCAHRCAYCDFNTYAGQEALIPAYVDALCKEVEFVGARFPTNRPSDYSTIGTIFFGGGTPSLLSPSQFDSIFRSIRANFNLTDDAEITIEANPGTVSFANLLELRSIGINRISFGVQSANMEELRMLERTHDFFDVIQAVTSARKAGFDNLNLDLIYGLPEQTLQTWQTSLQRILDLRPEHISAYALTLEHGTPFGRWSAKGLMPLPDPDLAAEMYEWASETLEANGYKQYEISNWAKEVKGQKSKVRPSTFDLQPWAPAFACKHNLQYWRSLPYLAFGAGAHGYADGYRYSNVLRIKTYIERLNTDHRSLITAFPLSPVTVNHHKQTLQDDMSEFMMTGLRLTQEGISEAEFADRFGTSLRDVYEKEIDELLRLGLIEWHSVGATGLSPLRITKRARLLANQVFMRFV